MPEEETDDFQKRLERIETLIQQLQTARDPAVQTSAQELVQVLLDLHAEGLERMLDIVWEEAEAREQILYEALPDDNLVSSLLILHGLHPLGLEARIERALEDVRPYMHSHGGTVEFLGIEDGIVQLRLGGSCDGCQASTITLKYAVEDAIYEAAPEVNGVEAVGLPDETEEASDDAFIPLDQVAASAAAGNGRESPSSTHREAQEEVGEWHAVDDLAVLEAGTVEATRVAGHSLIFFRGEGNLYAYMDECPSCHQSLSQARLDGVTLTCPHCEQAFDGGAAGRALEADGLQLDPVPLLEEEGHVKIALPEAAADGRS